MTAIVASSALVSVLAMAPRQEAAAQRFQCYPIRPGDTAAKVARHLTGDQLNRRASWFQIVDGRGRFVSKADYEEIRPGWRACLAVGPPQTAAFQPFGRPDASPVSEPRTALAGGSPVWWLVPVGLAALCASLAAALLAMNSWKKRRALAQIMQRFGGDFVREFGRPWMQYRGAGPSPRAQLRISPSRARLEILVSPPPGGTYPNLSDHRSNVEYDVARVTAALKHESFASGRPYAEGEWVVLPFHFKGRVHKEGVR